ncbi:uncharacterized protein LOC141651989 [Silene latifolia]|uniref:uncharacterized protein LOC141651989 n=1 Tax=Silene latifolia TaxID=37657 RepID=UPI003D77B574
MFPHNQTPLIKLKLIIDKNTKQLLFAEANKDFVDFLFNIPSLPIASFLNLSQTDGKNCIVAEGSLGNLYNTIKNMDSSHFRFINTRETLIERINSSNSIQHGCCDHVQAGKYMVMDDLTVEPMSTVSLHNRLNELGDYGSAVNKLEEKEVQVGKLAVERLLKESLVTKKVLSTVFLGDKYKDNEDANVSFEDYFNVGGQRPGAHNACHPCCNGYSSGRGGYAGCGGYVDQNTYFVGEGPQGLYGSQTSQPPSQPPSQVS